MSLKPVAPVPLSDDELELAESGSTGSTNSSSSSYTKFPYFGVNSTFNIRRVFYKTQKWSAIIFSGFVGVHLFNMIIVPNISALMSVVFNESSAFDTISTADDLMMMLREFYQNSFIEKWLLFGSLGLHVFSGISLRIYNAWFLNVYGKKRSADKKLPVNNNDEILLQKSVKKVLSHTKGSDGSTSKRQDDYLISDDYIGLNGINSFISRYIFNSSSFHIVTKSKVSRYFFNLNPIQFSGYVLIFPLAFHVMQLRIVPLIVDGDSSMMDLTFFKFVINQYNSVLQNWLLFSGYGVLLYSATYHIISGWFKFAKVYSLRKKFKGYLLGISLTIGGLLLIWWFLKDNVGVVLDRNVFTKYLDYLH